MPPQHPLSSNVEALALAGQAVPTVALILGISQDTVRIILRRLGFERVERWERKETP